ncbi:hypothetical protein GQ457_09G012730 [Hibiscus cannabinus]
MIRIASDLQTHQVQKDNQGNQRDSQYKPQYSRFQQGRGNRGGRGRVRLQCQLCGKYGHSVDRCWHRFNQDFAGVMATSNESADVHLRAMHHTTPDESKVVNGVDYNGPGKLVVGNGHSLQISKTGYAFLPTESRALVINDLLVVPSITKSLISVSKFARDNVVYFEFHAQRCVVKDERTGEMLLEGQENNGLYQFSGLKSTVSGQSIEVNTASTNKSYDLWHMRLGHLARASLVAACKQIESCNNLHDTGQRVLSRVSKLTVVNKVHRMNTPQVTRNDAGPKNGVRLASKEGLQCHDDEMSTSVQQETGGSASQPLMDHSLGHARQDTGVVLADGELEPDQMVSSNPVTDEGFYETALEEEEANQVSIGADQVTEMVSSSEQEISQSNNIDSDNAMHHDVGATLSSQQDDVMVTQLSDYFSMFRAKLRVFSFDEVQGGRSGEHVVQTFLALGSLHRKVLMGVFHQFLIHSLLLWCFYEKMKCSPPQACLRPIKSHKNWKAPPADVVKCNFDVANESTATKSISGIICRDRDGYVLAACSTTHYFVTDPFQAETLACLMVIKFARDLGFTRVIIECDFLTVIMKCRSKLINVSLISPVIADIKDASKFFESISFGFVHREANEVAHSIAHEGKAFNSPMY